MKALKALLLVGIAALAFALPALAADDYGISVRPSPSGKVHANWTTNTGPILVAGSFTTNLPATAAYIMPVPSSGFSLFLRTGGTNAADTTNLVIVLEGVMFPTGSSAGGTQVVDNAVITISTPTTQSTLPTGYDYLTNILITPTTGNQLGRVDGIRIRSIQNTNLNSIWVSNLFQLRD